MQFTTNQGPSAHNQTSDDHSRDPNQDKRQPSVKNAVDAAGLKNEIPADVVNTATKHDSIQNSENSRKVTK